MYTYFKTETVDHSIGRLLSEKKYGGTATSSYSATDEFSQHIYSVLVAKNDQKIRSRCLVHEFFFTGIVLKILIMVTEQLYWRKTLCGCFRFIWLWLLIAIMKRCAERWALQLFRASLSILILFQLQSWIILRVRSKFLFKNFHTTRVIMEVPMMMILSNCIFGTLHNNYFPLNESSSLY